MSRSFTKNLGWAALAGCLSWSVYGLVYFVYFYAVPVAVLGSRAYLPQSNWVLAALYVIAYGAAGVVAGTLASLGIGALAQQRRPESSFSGPGDALLAATFTLPATLFAALLFQGWPNRQSLFLLAIEGLLAGSLIATIMFPWRFRAARAALDPWTVSLILVGIPWAWYRGLVSSAIGKVLAGIVILAGFWCLSLLARRIFRAVSRISPWGCFVRATALLGALAFGVCGWFYQIGRAGPGALVAARLNGRASGPNVVLIVLDTVRADHLSLWGYPRQTSPALEDLAREASVYRNAVATSNMTLSTHASIFTGMYTRRHGAHFLPGVRPLGRPLDAEWQTLAEVLEARGYATGGIVANYRYLGKEFGFGQGFQMYDERQFVDLSRADSNHFLHGLISRFVPERLVAEAERRHRRAEEINDAAGRFLEAAGKANASFFLFLNHMDAHYPFVPPPPFDRAFPGVDREFKYFGYASMRSGVLSGRREIEPREADSMISQYDGAIRYIDQQIGVLLEQLKQHGQFENSFVIVTSDHGEAFGEDHLIGHSVTTHQSQVAVPLIIKYPRQNTGQVIERLVSQIDILPTVLDVLGLPVPEGVDGISLVSAGDDRTSVVSESFSSPYHDGLGKRYQLYESAVFSDGLKLVTESGGRQRLYDLRSDPAQERDLYVSEAAKARLLTTILMEFESRVPESKPTDEKTGDRPMLERLRSLGYVR